MKRRNGWFEVVADCGTGEIKAVSEQAINILDTNVVVGWGGHDAVIRCGDDDYPAQFVAPEE